MTGIPPSQSFIADCRWLIHILGSWLPAAGNGLPAVVPVFTGALDRIFGFVQTIKDSAAMTEAISTGLGVKAAPG